MNTGQAVHVVLKYLATADDKTTPLTHLGAAKSTLQFGHAKTKRLLRMMEVLAVGEGVSPQASEPAARFRVRRQDHATLARANNFISKKREAGIIAATADRLAVGEFCEMSFAAVFD